MIPATNNNGTDFTFFTSNTVDLETYEKLLNPVEPLDRKKIDRENLARLHDSRQKRERHRNLRKGR